LGQEIESQVNDLMAEAMQEASPTAPKTTGGGGGVARPVPPTPTQVFFFPDEDRVRMAPPPSSHGAADRADADDVHQVRFT